MKTETIEKIFNFLEEKEGKEIPEAWFDLIKKLKLIKELENHPDGSQYKHNGNLNLSDTSIEELPNDLNIVGWLSLNNTKIKKLPDDLYVGKHLTLYGCEQLTKLPDNLYVGGYLYLEQTNIEELPNNLYVGGNLFIRDTPLANKYTNEEIYKIVTSTGGQIIVDIIRF